MFNGVYRRMVEETNGELRWLDFFEGLLSSDGTDFNRNFELDGTHMNPLYLSLLAGALNKNPHPTT